jgi:hypothetical protein
MNFECLPPSPVTYPTMVYYYVQGGLMNISDYSTDGVNPPDGLSP